jgi:hypothetical protein
VLVVLWTVRRGRELEPALIDTFSLFAVLLSLLYPWYLITVFALLALRRTTLGFAFLCGATTLGLVYHPLSVWAWFNSTSSPVPILPICSKSLPVDFDAIALPPAQESDHPSATCAILALDIVQRTPEGE